jgi:hypothetical protein
MDHLDFDEEDVKRAAEIMKKKKAKVNKKGLIFDSANYELAKGQKARE